MRLHRLTVAGFKSFGNRTTLEFDAGVTAVIGPNGSGKSNVLDALKWATGGGRAREFRAGEKTELIFHGARGKKRLGFAEVEVELERDGRPIKIQRSLARDGTTKLRLNGRGARFLDIDEVLSGSGLGRNSLAVIGQGEVSQVLMADPARLLEYVAEVAGVSRLSSRRDQAANRLETALDHLERLEQLMVGERERIAVLEEEAADAQRHRELTAEALRLRYTAIRARLDALRRECEQLAGTASELEERLAAGTEALAEARRARDAARKRLEAQEEAYRTAWAESEQKRGDLRVAEAEVRAARERRDALAGQWEARSSERRALEALQPPLAPEGDAEVLDARVADAEATLTAAREALAPLAEAERAAREERESLERRAGEAERQRAVQEAQRDGLVRQVHELEARLAEPDTGAPREALEQAEREAEARTEARARAERTVQAARERVEAHQEAHARAAAEAGALERAVQRQRASLDARRGYAEGPRHALTSGHPGVLGSVADLVVVPERYRTALAAALGRRAEYVVVEDADAAREVLEHVRKAGGWVTLLPLDLLRARPRHVDEAFLDADGVLGLAAEQVEVAERYRPVVDHLLGATALVPDVTRATELARAFPRRPRMVTVDGALVEPGGAVSGGKRLPRAGVIGAAAELEAAEAQLADAVEERERHREALEVAQGELRDALAAQRDAADEAEAARKVAAEAREQQAASERLRADLDARLRDARKAVDALPAAPAEAIDEARLAEARRIDAEARQRVEEARAAVEEARDALLEAQRERELDRERRRAFADAQERYRRDLARREELDVELERLREALEGAEEAVRTAEAGEAEARARMPTDLERVEAAFEEARAAAREAEEALEKGSEAQAQRSEQLESARVQRARREAALEAAEEEAAGFPDGVEPLELGERAARARLRDAEAELEALGDVNHRAARDLEEQQAKVADRMRDAERAEEAVHELQATLTRLDRETTDRLRASVTRLRSSFRAHVAELFGAEGEGDIATEEADDGRPVGLRIRLQPPGKQTQALNLLSVGERTMGALAFLFALMGEETDRGGLPVAVLDEVDAPLDEANIRRYCTFVQRLANQGTQFVLITHQKATFEVADVLWGVTTEHGVSRVFSIRREQAVAATA